MTREVLVSLSPTEVIELAKGYFTDPESGYSGTLVEQGEGYVRFQTFRGYLAVSARPDDGRTRVRCSTLRYHSSIGKFLLQLQTAAPSTPGS
jgi:hypothetical protein